MHDSRPRLSFAPTPERGCPTFYVEHNAAFPVATLSLSREKSFSEQAFAPEP
jgi:hypothetical protein